MDAGRSSFCESRGATLLWLGIMTSLICLGAITIYDVNLYHFFVVCVVVAFALYVTFLVCYGKCKGGAADAALDAETVRVPVLAVERL